MWNRFKRWLGRQLADVVHASDGTASARTWSPVTRTCPHCDTPISAIANFCPMCGGSLIPALPAAPTSAPEPPALPLPPDWPTDRHTSSIELAAIRPLPAMPRVGCDNPFDRPIVAFQKQRRQGAGIHTAMVRTVEQQKARRASRRGGIQ